MKSHESDQLCLAELIYYDAVAKCTATKPDLRDLETFRSRIEHEGLSFLTITLPQFGKDFERSLANGSVDSSFFRSFKKNGSIPAFLQGMVSQVFDQSTGRLRYESEGLDHCDLGVIGAVRQIAFSFKKLELECEPRRVRQSLENFVLTESDLEEAVAPDLVNDFVNVSRILYADVLADISVYDLYPSHGPGATAERVSGNQKFQWQFWHERLEPYFPLLDNAYTISSYGSKEFEDVTFVKPDQEQPVRVTPVPKTLKGPRIIAIEPCCMQYAQQAIRRVLYNSLERAPLTKGHVNFTDQSVNRQLAMSSSSSEDLATLDLTDASDRVKYDLAIRMFDSNPELKDAISACRSERAELPDGRIIGPLRKFASMGSALCFPVESMYFYTICIGALLKVQNLPVTRHNVKYCSASVYVYGDDIIVPVTHAVAVASHLQKYLCKVNMSKSFWTGKFRESCGMDAYAGEEVTPTYIRQLAPCNRRQADNLVSWIKTANAFYKRGYWQTSSHMLKVCERILGPLPYVAENSPGLGRISFRQFRSIGRWNTKLQRLEVKAWVAEPVYRTDGLEGYGALMKSLNLLRTLGSNPDVVVDPKHLERSALHGAVTLKRRWIMVD